MAATATVFCVSREPFSTGTTYRPISLWNTNANFNKTLANLNKRNIHNDQHDQVGFLPEMTGWFNIY